jgi:hypothetical protein
MGSFEIISPKDGHSKMTKKIEHPVQPTKKLFLQNVKIRQIEETKTFILI